MHPDFKVCGLNLFLDLWFFKKMGQGGGGKLYMKTFFFFKKKMLSFFCILREKYV